MCEYIIAEDFNMDKYIFDKSNGLWYELAGDYYSAIPISSLREGAVFPVSVLATVA